LLKPYGKGFTRELEYRPMTAGFLLIAKAKPPEAEPVVRTLRETPRWSKDPNARIAAAALGDTELEKECEARFTLTSDPQVKAEAAHTLGLIGTEPALRALASELRTGLVIDKPEAYFKRSVRVDILEALSYNFPDEPALYTTQIHDDSGYERAEQFCQKRLGVSWDHPRPPFLTIGGYPLPPR
ncbi:MAG TPA: hypothetical protein VGL72_10045, partial [Bryobacteraceae bacterium]|jgi:hypothetical protein